jgi:hypothetical protein
MGMTTSSARQPHSDEITTGSTRRPVDPGPGWVDRNYDSAHPEKQCTEADLPSVYRSTTECYLMNKQLNYDN